MSQYKIEAGTGQHIGDRHEQQDRVGLFAAPHAPGYMMAVVADGMGGKSGGALAAEQVVRTAKQLFDEFYPGNDVQQLLENILNEAHTIIKLTAVSSEKEPHSTFVALVITPQQEAIWAHAGDSRLYRFSGPNFSEKTRDHSYVERLVDEGKILPEEAKTHKLSNILINVLGSTNVSPSISVGKYVNLKVGDSFLLCTDGLWHYFENTELSAAVAANTPRQASELLIRKARDRGTPRGDNCTFAIIKLIEPPPEVKNYTAEKIRRAV
ncbi:PP2C family protein-serine/threonine phosphatase [Undibacterium sp. RuRC25W]|uniref:PP2C family protein-serine/threonine phosphatase n=1 Tax=Undibacterium sp. RuRC25W TaxID=3413047 RepID=UPI003BF1B2CD